MKTASRKIQSLRALSFGFLLAFGMNARASESLVIYCGRGEELVGPLMKQFEDQSGLKLQIRYAGTPELAATILEEGRNSPADVFFGQDAGAMGALSRANRLIALPVDIVHAVPASFRSTSGQWVGISGRARVVVYNTAALEEPDLPEDLFGFCDPSWRGRLGWAPENASFQSFVTALVVREGKDRALAWLRGIKANEPRVFAKNSAIVAAVGAGEIDAGFVNHYYLYSARRTDPEIKAANYYFPQESAGNLVNVAGAGILDTSRNKPAALEFLRFLLSADSQTFFAEKTGEYPLSGAIPAGSDLRPLENFSAPSIDLDELEDLESTLELIHEAGVL